MSSSKGNSPHKRYTRKQKLLIGSEKYVEFRMPKEKTLTEQEWQALVKNTRVIKYPKVQLSIEINNIKNQYRKRIKEYDMTMTEYLKEADLTQPQFDKQVEEMAKANVKAKLVLHAIAEKNGYQ